VHRRRLTICGAYRGGRVRDPAPGTRRPQQQSAISIFTFPHGGNLYLDPIVLLLTLERFTLPEAITQVVDAHGGPMSHEGLRDLLRKEGVRFQVIKTWKRR
jgi:hypothetical protein